MKPKKIIRLYCIKRQSKDLEEYGHTENKSVWAEDYQCIHFVNDGNCWLAEDEYGRLYKQDD